jgi:hypothetical protein
MLATIRRLERYLVCQLAQVTLEPLVEDYLERWQIALDNRRMLPDPIEFAQTISDNGVPILAFTPLHAYLMGCADDWRLPDPDRIIATIVHGHAEMRLKLDRTCRCPARKDLCGALASGESTPYD